MNQVKTYIDKSSIHGIGLFAAEFIPKGTLIWKFSGADIIIKSNEFDNLSSIEREYVEKYGMDKNGIIILCSDDAKYCNHSKEANTYGYPEQYSKIDIQIGDEITCDYYEILDESNVDLISLK